MSYLVLRNGSLQGWPALRLPLPRLLQVADQVALIPLPFLNGSGVRYSLSRPSFAQLTVA